MSTMTDIQIERWRQHWKDATADTSWLATHTQRDEKRRAVRTQMLALLDQYLSSHCNTEQLRETFDQKTKTEWDVFGFKGMSGAMFLNKLVKHVSDQGPLAEQLRRVLPLPSTIEDARNRMHAFMDFLTDSIRAGDVTKAQLQPARTPFFVSAWWHLQDVEQWPVFYLSGRKALELEGLYRPSQDPVEDYFVFRELFLALASALSLGSWQLEHLFNWLDKQDEEETPGGDDVGGDEEEDGGDYTDELSHTHVQWLLAKIGQKLGCKVWIATNDHGKEWRGQRLGDFSVDALPSLGLDEESQNIIRRIDVLWLKGMNQVAAAFEIEQTTSIYSGLLRMSDLTALSPNLNFPLYLVAPESRLDKVRNQLARPTFQTLELHKRCGFFSSEALVREAEGIMRWASDPSAIEALASKVGDVIG